MLALRVDGVKNGLEFCLRLRDSPYDRTSRLTPVPTMRKRASVRNLASNAWPRAAPGAVSAVGKLPRAPRGLAHFVEMNRDTPTHVPSPLLNPSAVCVYRGLVLDGRVGDEKEVLQELVRFE